MTESRLTGYPPSVNDKEDVLGGGGGNCLLCLPVLRENIGINAKVENDTPSF